MHLVIYVKSIRILRMNFLFRRQPQLSWGGIRKEVRSLDFMPARYTLVDWEPWHSMKMHQLPVDNFIVYYLVDDEKRTVTVARIFYGGRDIEEIINSNK